MGKGDLSSADSLLPPCSIVPDLYVLAGDAPSRIKTPEPSLLLTAQPPRGSLAEDVLAGLPPLVFTADSRYYVPGGAAVLVFVNNTVRGRTAGAPLLSHPRRPAPSLPRQDPGEHPIHFHAHNYLVIATSENAEAEALYSPGNVARRDTVSVPENGWAKFILVVDVPALTTVHCHIGGAGRRSRGLFPCSPRRPVSPADWHMAAGLALELLEAPEQLQGFKIPDDHAALCKAQPSAPLPTALPAADGAAPVSVAILLGSVFGGAIALSLVAAAVTLLVFRRKAKGADYRPIAYGSTDADGTFA